MQVFSCEYCEIFKNSFFTELLWWLLQHFLKVINTSRPDPGQREKINLYFYFHTSLWCFFVVPLKLIFISIQLSEMNGAERVNQLFRKDFVMTVFSSQHVLERYIVWCRKSQTRLFANLSSISRFSK